MNDCGLALPSTVRLLNVRSTASFRETAARPFPASSEDSNSPTIRRIEPSGVRRAGRHKKSPAPAGHAARRRAERSGSRSDRVGAWPRGRARRWRTGDIVDGRCQPDCVATRPDVLRGSSRSSAPWRRRLATGEAALTGEGLIRRGAAERPSPYRGPQKPPAARLKSPRPRFGIAGACG